jgi:hypothetical protein
MARRSCDELITISGSQAYTRGATAVILDRGKVKVGPASEELIAHRDDKLTISRRFQRR